MRNFAVFLKIIHKLKINSAMFELVFGAILWLIASFFLRLIGFADTHILFMAIAWTAGVLAFLIQVCRKRNIDRWMRIVIFTGYAGRCALSAANILSGYAISRRSDSKLFMRGAQELYQHIPTDCLNFSYLINAEFHIFGVNEYLVDLMNHLTILFTVLLVYYYGKQIGANAVLLKLSVLYLMFTPFQITYTMLPFREGWYVLCGACCFLFVEKWLDTQHWIFFGLAFICCLLPAWLHKGNISWIVALFITGSIYLIWRIKSCFNNGQRTFVCLFIMLCIAILLGIGGHSQISVWEERLLAILNSFQYAAYVNMPGNSDYLSLLQYNSLWEVVIWTPIRMVYYFLSPMPWDWRGPIDVIVFFANSMFHLTVLSLVVWFLWTKRKKGFLQNGSVWFALLLLMATMFVYCWGTKNAGTAVRHRDNLLAIEWMIVLKWQSKELRD